MTLASSSSAVPPAFPSPKDQLRFTPDPPVMPHFPHKFIAKVVFPIEGRAATIIKSPGCKPAVFLSKSVKPVEIPVTPPIRILCQHLNFINGIFEDFIHILRSAFRTNHSLFGNLQNLTFGSIQNVFHILPVSGITVFRYGIASSD